MIARYKVLTERLRSELQPLEQIVERVEGALARSVQQPENEIYFIAAAALDLHGFYVGLEHLFEMIATEIDGGLPKSARWHRDLLEQMTLSIQEVRPAVISSQTRDALVEYLEFRHVVCNVYTSSLRSERLSELVQALRLTFELVQRDLLAFAEFLDNLAKADDFDETLWLKAAATNPAFDFLNDPEEDIYTLADGKPLQDEV